MPDVAPLADLRLWPYSESLRTRLHDRLPHRAARIGVPGDGAGLVDMWSFGIGHATFVDVHRPDAATDWDGLRDEVARVRSRESFLVRAAPLATGITASRVGEPLWAQRMLLVEAPPGTDTDAMERIGRTLSPDGQALVGTAEPGSASVRLVSRRASSRTGR